MDYRRGQDLDAERLAARHRAALVVEAPEGERRAGLRNEVALRRLRRQVEDLPVPQRAHQLDVLRVRPDERHRRTRGAAVEEFPPREVGRVPDLFGYHPAVARLRGHHAEQALGLRATARGQLVVAALARQQRPPAPDARAVEGAAVLVLAVAVEVVAVPDRPRRGLGLEQRVYYFDGVDDARVSGLAQAEAHERKRVGADNFDGGDFALVGRAVLDGHEAPFGRSGVGHLRRRDAHVVALDAHLPREFRPRAVSPTLDVVVPGVGGLAQVARGRRLARALREVGGLQQRRDLHREREGREAAVLLPTVLLRDGAVAHDVGGGPAHHRPR